MLVRCLVEDDAKQSALAAALIDRAIANDEALFVSDIVACETVWVLSGSCDVGLEAIAALLARRFRARHLTFSALDVLRRALDAYTAGKGDFADYLIRGHARRADHDAVATFDRALLREPAFVAVVAGPGGATLARTAASRGAQARSGRPARRGRRA